MYGRTLWPAIAVDYWQLHGDGRGFPAVRYLSRYCAGANRLLVGQGDEKSPAIEAGLSVVAWR